MERLTDRQTRRKQTRQTEAMSHSSLVRGFITEMKFVFICLEPRSFQCLNNFRLWQYSHYLFFNTSILGKNIASHLKLKSFSSCFVEKWKSNIYPWSLLKIVLRISWWYSCSWKIIYTLCWFFLIWLIVLTTPLMSMSSINNNLCFVPVWSFQNISLTCCTVFQQSAKTTITKRTVDVKYIFKHGDDNCSVLSINLFGKALVFLVAFQANDQWINNIAEHLLTYMRKFRLYLIWTNTIHR